MLRTITIFFMSLIPILSQGKNILPTLSNCSSGTVTYSNPQIVVSGLNQGDSLDLTNARIYLESGTASTPGKYTIPLQNNNMNTQIAFRMEPYWTLPDKRISTTLVQVTNVSTGITVAGLSTMKQVYITPNINSTVTSSMSNEGKEILTSIELTKDLEIPTTSDPNKKFVIKAGFKCSFVYPPGISKLK